MRILIESLTKLSNMLSKLYLSIGKIIIDFFFAFIGVLLLVPVFMFLALLIKLTSKGPALFKQTRLGKNFKPFTLYKFRSMIIDAPKLGPGVTSADDPRITRVGKFLRKTKLDELPQLINVIKGDMSLVGPRPELTAYINEYKEEYRTVLSIRPGITDYAAIEFRDEENILNNYSDKEKAYLEIVLPKKITLYKKYINKISMVTDLKIILLTLKKIIG
ncbi:MAG: sugar transferase [Candidatus Margulisbacteria bacterium GWE2_39_32]|nr:MAG: sugar transferase [Candidatus Margulisbacteria bacterium GWE2_39_32]